MGWCGQAPRAWHRSDSRPQGFRGAGQDMGMGMGMGMGQHAQARVDRDHDERQEGGKGWGRNIASTSMLYVCRYAVRRTGYENTTIHSYSGAKINHPTIHPPFHPRIYLDLYPRTIITCLNLPTEQPLHAMSRTRKIRPSTGEKAETHGPWRREETKEREHQMGAATV